MSSCDPQENGLGAAGDARADRRYEELHERAAQSVDAMLEALISGGEMGPELLLNMLLHMGFRIRSVSRDEARPRFLIVDLGPQENLALGLAALFIIRSLPGVLGAIEAADEPRVVYVRV